MSSAHSWPEGDAFNAELNNLTRASSSKINAIADMAMSLYKHYKLVVHSLEKYVKRSTRDNRLFGLYIIDALLRRSRAKFGEGARDMFATRLSVNMLLTFAKLIEVRSFDLPRVHKILQSWRAKNTFATELQDEMEAIFESAQESANPDDDDNDDEDEDERKRQQEGEASPVPPTGDESPREVEQMQTAPVVPAPYAPRPVPPSSAGSSRDPRRAAHAQQSHPPPPPSAPVAPAATDAASNPTMAALANLQSMLAVPTPAAPAHAPVASATPVAPVAATAATAPAPMLPAAPLLPPPAVPIAEDDWGYDDEDEEEEDEEARKEKLRVRLEQEKVRMEAAQIDMPSAAVSAAPTPTNLQTPQDPFGHFQFPPLAAAAPPVQVPPAPDDAAGTPAAPARRSRFGAPKSKEEVEASLAAAAPALLHSTSASSGGGGGSYERHGPTSPPSERRRSRSRSRERDQQRSSYPSSHSSAGPGGPSSSIGGPGSSHSSNARPSRDNQNPGFIRLPDAEQVGTSWVRVLSTTLRVGHAPLSSLGIDVQELRTMLREKFSVFGQVDWLNPTEKQSYVRFRTRRDACVAKSNSQSLQIGGAPARLNWAKAREMDQEMFNQNTGEGSVETGAPVLAKTPVEAPDLQVDEDFREKRRGRVTGGGAGAAAGGAAPNDNRGRVASQGPESYPVAPWTQAAAAAAPQSSPYATQQQVQSYPHAMAFLAQQQQQPMQQMQQGYPPAEAMGAAVPGPYAHPSRSWMQQ